MSKKKKPVPLPLRPATLVPSVLTAIKNVTIVVSNVRMTRQEHMQLQQDLMLIAQRCELADKLEKKAKE